MEKNEASLLLFFALCCTEPSGKAQGNFQNLGFEAANLSPIPAGEGGGLVPITDAMPGWAAFLGTNEITQVLHNDLTVGSASVDILGPFWNTTPVIIAGRYTVVLQPGIYFPDRVNASISQAGLIPVNSKSLQFYALADFFSVSFAGQDLTVIPIGSGSNYTIFGADVSQFAGQIGTLTITATSGPAYFDSFVFSSQAVPEPGLVALVGLGVLVLASQRRRSRERERKQRMGQQAIAPSQFSHGHR